MNRKRLAVLSMAAVLVWPGLAWAGLGDVVRWVRPNASGTGNGTVNTDVLAWTLNQANANAAAGQTVRLAAGTYTGGNGGNLAPIANGAAGNYIWFLGDSANPTNVTLVGDVYLTAKDYISVRGLKVNGRVDMTASEGNHAEADSISWCNVDGFQWGGSKNSVIYNNTIGDSSGNESWSDAFCDTGLGLATTVGSKFIGNTMLVKGDCTGGDPKFGRIRGAENITVSDNRLVTVITAHANCTTAFESCAGFYIMNVRGSRFERNRVIALNRTGYANVVALAIRDYSVDNVFALDTLIMQGAAVFWSGSCQACYGTSGRNTLRNCWLIGLPGAQPNVFRFAKGESRSDTVKGNVFIGTGINNPNLPTVLTASKGPLQNLQWFNNTVFSPSSIPIHWSQNGVTMPGAKVFNNILYAKYQITGDLHDPNLYVDAPIVTNAAVKIDHNLYYKTYDHGNGGCLAVLDDAGYGYAVKGVNGLLPNVCDFGGGTAWTSAPAFHDTGSVFAPPQMICDTNVLNTSLPTWTTFNPRLAMVGATPPRAWVSQYWEEHPDSVNDFNNDGINGWDVDAANNFYAGAFAVRDTIPPSVATGMMTEQCAPSNPTTRAIYSFTVGGDDSLSGINTRWDMVVRGVFSFSDFTPALVDSIIKLHDANPTNCSNFTSNQCNCDGGGGENCTWVSGGTKTVGQTDINVAIPVASGFECSDLVWQYRIRTCDEVGNCSYSQTFIF